MTAWWRRGVRADVEQQLEQIAHDRLRIFLPIVVGGIAIGLVISEPAGIPVPLSLFIQNLLMIAIAIALYTALRRRVIPSRLVHAVAAFVWLLAPINTL